MTMGLRLFNTLSRQMELFVPRDPAGKAVGIYCCGPTVHDFAHIGNFRIFVFADLLCRYFRYRNYDVTQVMNVTDVEDKIIARVNESRVPLREYTGKYLAAFFEDLDALGCRRPDHSPRAVDYIPEIIELIAQLIAKGVAYQMSGSVYFSIQRYRDQGNVYGKLTNLDFDALRPGRRVSDDEYEKGDAADFALWKARVPEDGEIFWESPWGEGRPGWHIECSAMSMAVLGPSFDLHLGGEDLMFPHHEDEIAQSEGCGAQVPGEPFVRYWLHGAHLVVEGRKMSKSLNNFFTLRDLKAKGFSGRTVRFVLASTHYRETFNFTNDGLRAGHSALKRIDACLDRLECAAGQENATEPDPVLLEDFERAMDQDLNLSSAWAAVFDWVREINRRLDSGLSASAAAAHLLAWKRIDYVLGIGHEPVEPEVPEDLRELLEERRRAREAKEYGQADEIRDQLAARGWTVEDTPQGARIKRT